MEKVKFKALENIEELNWYIEEKIKDRDRIVSISCYPWRGAYHHVVYYI